MQCPPWTDLNSKPVMLECLPCDDLDNRWVVEDGADTDEDGWTYGTTFEYLAFPRDGGRSTKRSTDWVRRRVWRRSVRADHANMAYVLNMYKQKRYAFVGCVGLAHTIILVYRQCPELTAAHKRSAMQTVLDMFKSAIERRSLLGVIPLDPTAWVAMFHTSRRRYTMQVQQTLLMELHEEPSVLRPHGCLYDDLIHASMHSEAAYGYVGLYLGTLAGFLAVHTLQRLHFNVVDGASASANIDTVCQRTGMDKDDVLFSHWRNSVYRPCFYLAVSRQLSCLVLSIRCVSEVVSTNLQAPRAQGHGASG